MRTKLKERQEKRLDNLKAWKVKAETMDFCHIVTHPLSNEQPDGKFSFDADSEDNWCHGFDAPGDLEGAFSLIKEGVLKYIDTNIKWVEEEMNG